MTIQNDSSGVVCGLDPSTLPNNTMGDALECTHVTETTGRFTHGLTVDLVDNGQYTFSFYFRNGNFDMPYNQTPSTIGITMKSPNGGGYTALSTFDPFPNQWYRQRFSFTATATGSHQIGFTHTLARPAGGGYWLYGFQVEEGFSVSDYVPE